MTFGEMWFLKLFSVFLLILSLAKAFIIDPSVGYSRVFDGIGGISGGGATSKLLVNYPEQQRNQILDYLFKPNFGAGLQILKVEIGGDAQTTDGGESSHMHESWDENYTRGYEWWIMREAKKRNPDIKLAALPWAFPGWIGGGTSSPYNDVTLLADYVTRWLVAAKTVHNLTIDYVGIWNEKPYNVEYVKTLRKTLDSRHLKHIQIVVADGGWEVTDDIVKDAEFSRVVDVIGVHYPGTQSSDAAKLTRKSLWASEDYSTFNDNVGAGCWARILNRNYVQGLMTSTISWNLIASYYSSLPFGGDGLMTANQPWTGHYIVNNPIWITAHTTQFTSPGWRYLHHNRGVAFLDHGGSLVTLMDPRSGHVTIVMEKMSHDHSICVRPPLPPYDTTPENVTLTLGGPLANLKSLNVWYSRLGFGNQTDKIFAKLAPVQVKNSQISIMMELDTIYTLTTLSSGNKGYYPKSPPQAPFPLPYHDSFDGYANQSEANNLASQIGTFETISVGGSHGKVLRQQVLTRPIDWCGLPLLDVMTVPATYIGNYTWSDVTVAADILVPTINATKGAFLGTRIDKGGCGTFSARGVFMWIFPPTQQIQVTGDLARTKLLWKKSVKLDSDTWYRMELRTKGSKAAGSLNGKEVFSEVDISYSPKNGFVGLGTSCFGHADFDNFNMLRTV